MTETSDEQINVDLVAIATRIRNEVQIALLNWATVEAFNSSSESIEANLKRHGGWEPAKFLVKALVRDVLMTLMRVTDDPDADRQTLLMFRKRWENANVGTLPCDIADHQQKVFENVPLAWKNSTETELSKLRGSFRNVRHNLIAHALDFSELDLPDLIPKIRPFLNLVAELVYHAAAMVGIADDDLEDRRKFGLSEAQRFWKHIA